MTPDQIDYKILDLLQADARLDVARLAQLVNLTKTPVHKRLQKLREQGYIKAHITLLDREKVGQPVLVVMQVKLKAQNQAGAFEQAVALMPEIQSCLHVSGDWDFILQANAKTPQAYYHFLTERISSLENVAQVESAFVLRECKNNGPLVLFC